MMAESSGTLEQAVERFSLAQAFQNCFTAPERELVPHDTPLHWETTFGSYEDKRNRAGFFLRFGPTMRGSIPRKLRGSHCKRALS